MLLVAVGVLAGCGNAGSQASGKSAGRAGALLAPNWVAEREVLRARADPARGRLWVLGLDSVHVYDFATRRLLRKITLPGWSVARNVCMPDLVLDRAGSAWISSNVQSRLWRIDGVDFSASETEIRLPEREGWDIGFGALAFGADGDLFALTSTAGTFWKIDLGAASGRMIDLGVSPAYACDLAGLLEAVAMEKGRASVATIQK